MPDFSEQADSISTTWANASRDPNKRYGKGRYGIGKYGQGYTSSTGSDFGELAGSTTPDFIEG